MMLAALACVLLWPLSTRAQSQAAGQAAGQGAAAIPIADFFRLPDVFRPELSPDGRHLAFLARAGSHLGLAVIDIDRRTSRMIATLPGTDIVEHHWVNAQRLVFVSGNVSDPAGTVNPGRSGGLFAVDVDGSHARRLALAAGDSATVIVRPRHMRMLMALSDGSDDVIVASNERNFDASDVYRLNTRSGRKTLLTFDNPGDVVRWALDRDGVPRAALTRKGLIDRVAYRRDDRSPWQRWAESDFREPSALPLAIDGEGAIIGLAPRGGADPRQTAALVRLDERGQTVAVLAQSDEFDAQAPVFDPRTKRLVGVRYRGERPTVRWFDERWAALQRRFDQQLPGVVNHFLPPAQGRRMLVYSFSDRNPGTVYLYDFQSNRLEFLLDARPWIKPEQMAESRFVRFTARDGLPLTALLTLPRGVPARALPLVVVVHGGPWVPGYTWQWDAEAQFLASRGFAVLQPNFRGTLGFGARHWVASFRQWGLAMQDDLADGVQWAMQQGIADARRVAIYGASYGGYAALQGLVRTPELYQCAIDYVGVTDLTLFQSVSWSEMSANDFMRHLFPVMVGDAERDAAQLRATSPALNAERIVKPVLLAYGGEDRRVPLAHGERMREALERHGKSFEWVLHADEGHGFASLDHRIDFYARMEALLRRTLGR